MVVDVVTGEGVGAGVGAGAEVVASWPEQSVETGTAR